VSDLPGRINNRERASVFLSAGAWLPVGLQGDIVTAPLRPRHSARAENLNDFTGLQALRRFGCRHGLPRGLPQEGGRGGCSGLLGGAVPLISRPCHRPMLARPIVQAPGELGTRERMQHVVNM
jgi:hypothetical protein